MMRDRLIELLIKSDILCDTCGENTRSYCVEAIADYLLENGVIVPPCKIGQSIYRIGNGKIYGDWEVMYIQVYEDEILYIDDTNNYFYASDIGKTVFLTKEEAEKALRKEDEGK